MGGGTTSPGFSSWGSWMGWVLRLVETGIDGQSRSSDVMEINWPAGLGDIGHLGLTLAEAKQLLARVQQEVVAAQADKQRVAGQMAFWTACASAARAARMAASAAASAGGAG
jgi:hypothetical protein